ncbi:hypothetical protein [Acinetobacter proteolyticus]|nr:hypothetical protein [Acinetobacter proteolyticus]
MSLSNENTNIKPIIRIEGKMSNKDAGKVAIIMAYGKSIALIVASCTGLVTAITALIWRISG